MTQTGEKSAMLRFNCFLLREGLESHEQALRLPYRPGNSKEMTKLADSPFAPQGSSAYLQVRAENVPAWAKLLSPIFTELNTVLNFSNRFVIFLPVKDRTFAICFGYGSSALEWSHVEANFGLRFAARSLDSNAMTAIGSRRIDASARSQWVQIPTNAAINTFEIELDGEFTRKLVGRLNSGLEFPEIGGVVATDSVSFKLETDLKNVHRVLEKMLDVVESAPANPDLEFIDSLEPLRTKSEVVKQLERRLASEIFQDRLRATNEEPGEYASVHTIDTHIVAFAPPDDVSIENVHEFIVTRGSQSISFDSMDLESLRSTLFEFQGSFGVASLSGIKVMAQDSNGNPASPAKPLKHWLVFEAGDATRRYLLTLGKWYALAEKYSDRLNQDLSSVKDVTGVLNLRTWDYWGEKKSYERDYNEKATEGRDDLICLDRFPLYSEDGTQVEACDLLHTDGYLVHVKPYTGSQTLSHLFSQGFVSAQTLISDSNYRNDFLGAVTTLNSDLLDAAQQKPPRYVTYAIAYDGSQRLPEDLPTFSKVNLRSFAKRIKMLGSEATIARIQMTFKKKSDKN